MQISLASQIVLHKSHVVIVLGMRSNKSCYPRTELHSDTKDSIRSLGGRQLRDSVNFWSKSLDR